MTQKNLCKAKTKAGKPCRATPMKDGYCTFHSPARAEAQKAAHKKGGETPSTKIITLDGTTRISSAAKVDELLDKIINEVMGTETSRGGAFNLKKARCVGYLAAIKLRAFEVADIEDRLTALEERQGIKK